MLFSIARGLAGECTASPTPNLVHTLRRVDPVEEVYMVPKVNSGPLKKEILGCLVLSIKEMGAGSE